ncbi:hypothetical protein DPMN_125579 [Dreissena polymorpha]|uniref:Uncharacterized protein n=1 Tax=Dreissena polymorpha TaxID=45954 RepID=A0A9D4JXB8_DREPO|nr:hypothetical protein DPMN_125579 [Dreissena polymorpha]
MISVQNEQCAVGDLQIISVATTENRELHPILDTGFPPCLPEQMPLALLCMRSDQPLPAKLPTCQSF